MAAGNSLSGFAPLTRFRDQDGSALDGSLSQALGGFIGPGQWKCFRSGADRNAGGQL